MKVAYDKQVDALYLYLEKGKFSVSKEIEEGLVLDVGTKGELLGIEILDASMYFSKQKMTPSPFVRLKAPSRKIVHHKRTKRLVTV